MSTVWDQAILVYGPIYRVSRATEHPYDRNIIRAQYYLPASPSWYWDYGALIWTQSGLDTHYYDTSLEQGFVSGECEAQRAGYINARPSGPGYVSVPRYIGGGTAETPLTANMVHHAAESGFQLQDHFYGALGPQNPYAVEGAGEVQGTLPD